MAGSCKIQGFEKNMTRYLILLFCLVLIPAQVLAGTSALVNKIQKQYESLNSFKSTFVQELTNAASKEVEERRGSIVFKQPRLIRWETTSPEKELLIVTSEFVWDYFPQEDIAYKYSLGKILNSKTMLRFLSGEANISDDFDVKLQEMEDEWQKIKLIPHDPEPNLVLAYIWAEPETGLVRQILLVDFFGNGNQLTLEDLELDPELDKDLFSLSLPDDVEVIDSRTDS